jgi:hypothetical protein
MVSPLHYIDESSKKKHGGVNSPLIILQKMQLSQRSRRLSCEIEVIFNTVANSPVNEMTGHLRIWISKMSFVA